MRQDSASRGGPGDEIPATRAGTDTAPRLLCVHPWVGLGLLPARASKLLAWAMEVALGLMSLCCLGREHPFRLPQSHT